MRSTALRVTSVGVLVLAFLSATRARAQRTGGTRRVVFNDTVASGDRVQVAVRGRVVEVTLDRWSKPSRADPMHYRPWAHADMIDLGTVDEAVTRTIRGFFPVDSMRAFLHRLDVERAMPDSFRFASELPPTGSYVYLKEPTLGLEIHRRPLSVGAGGRYGIQGWGCRDRRLGVDASVDEWRRVVDGLRLAVRLASRARTIEATLPLRESEVPCPVRAFVGNPFPRLTGQVTNPRLAAPAVLEFVVDARGLVAKQSLRIASGDGSLGTAVSSVVRRWRFLPALDGDRRPVPQIVRLLAITDAPRTASDSIALYARARRERSQFILVARTLPPVQETIVTQDHQRLHVIAFDHAPSMVFLHGPGDSADDWEAVAALLAPAISSAAYDLRGHGASVRDDGQNPDDFTIESHVADLERVLESLNVARATLVTYDASAAIAAEFARRHPERVAALVLIAPTQNRAKATLESRVMSMRSILTPISVADMQRGFTYRAMWDDLGPKALVEERAHRLIPPRARAAVIQTIVSAFNYDLDAALASYSGPIYALETRNGSDLASAFRIDYFQAVRRGDATARRIIVRDLESGPWPMLAMPNAVAAQLRSIASEVR